MGFGKETVFKVELNRDGLNAAWGFRLKGGKDVDGGTPLEVIKISIGSAAEGELHVGDRILNINHRDASKLTHAEAQKVFQRAGTNCMLTVARPAVQPHFYPAPSQFPHPPPAPVDMWDNSNSYNQHQANGMNGGPPPPAAHPYRGKQDGGYVYTPAGHAPQSKTVNIGGVKQQVVTKQFNSPLNLYSDAAIADAVITNRNAGLIGMGSSHPGYVDERPHLPTPKDATISKPQQSELFKLVLESEMDQARDQQGVVGKAFHNQEHHHQPQQQPQRYSRPSSSMSNKSTHDPVLSDHSINQSTSFKRLMQAVMAEPEYYDPN